MGACTMFGQEGDTTILWSPESDDKMIAIIERMMAQGVTFFLLEPRFGGIVAPVTRPLEDTAEARRHRALLIKDEDLSKLVEGGAVAVASQPVTAGAEGAVPDLPADAPRRVGGRPRTRISRDAKEVAAGKSVAVRQRAGG